ncbi:GNAT family N-acetyltransferase [Solirubrobacter taibaiensis]|nr:GNAT family N-acetyltransferase [Solirubrobacter taibaiensis]
MTLDYPEPDLSDDTIALRRWAERDLACIQEAATDPRIPAGTTVPAVFDPDAGRAFIRRQRQRVVNGQGVSLAIDVAGRAVGLLWLGIRPQPRVVGLGYWIVPSARGRTYGTRAARLASTWALADAGMARVEAWVDPDNEPSLRLLASAGFEREGVLRAFLDLGDRRGDAVVLSRIA